MNRKVKVLWKQLGEAPNPDLGGKGKASQGMCHKWRSEE